MVTKFKTKCKRCNKNYVIVTGRDRYPVCYDCQEKDLQGEVSDPAMKELFEIPEDYYKKSMFLRSIKINYLRYGSLTEKQIAAFKKHVEGIESGE